MNEYLCRKCGRHCFSSASLNDLLNKNCPYVGCNGNIIEFNNAVPIQSSNISYITNDITSIITENEKLKQDIMQLEKDLDLASKYKAQYETAKEAMEKLLRSVPIAICRKYCKNASDHCSGWGDCVPSWNDVGK